MLCCYISCVSMPNVYSRLTRLSYTDNQRTDILTFGTLFASVFADAEGIYNIKRINNKFKYKNYEH